MASLLVVEDDDAIAHPLVRALERDGFEVQRVTSGQAALDEERYARADLVLLDLTLPDVDGLDVCQQLKTTRPDLPVIMLTARREEVDVVVGFDAGADDYVSKPFHMAELVARIRARLRGSPSNNGEAVHGVRIDAASHKAWLEGTEVALTPTEFDLLSILVESAGTVVTRDQIMRDVWARYSWGSTRVLDMHILALRRKLGDEPTRPRAS